MKAGIPRPRKAALGKRSTGCAYRCYVYQYPFLDVPEEGVPLPTTVGLSAMYGAGVILIILIGVAREWKSPSCKPATLSPEFGIMLWLRPLVSAVKINLQPETGVVILRFTYSEREATSSCKESLKLTTNIQKDIQSFLISDWCTDKYFSTRLHAENIT